MKKTITCSFHTSPRPSLCKDCALNAPKAATPAKTIHLNESLTLARHVEQDVHGNERITFRSAKPIVRALLPWELV